MTLIADSPPTTAYRLGAWDLSELLPAATEEIIAQRLGELEAVVEVFAAARERLSAHMPARELVACLRRYEEISERISVLSNYASLWFYADTRNQEALTFRNRVRQAVTKANNRILFFTLWWKSLPEEEARLLLPAEPAASGRRVGVKTLSQTLSPQTIGDSSANCGACGRTRSTRNPSRSSTSRTRMASRRC
jgi:oligoendopeptidase F